MASAANDNLRIFTVEGSVNLYDDQTNIGTAADKALAARLTSTNYDILAPDRPDVHQYFMNLRNGEHYIDKNNQNTQHWWDRKKKYPSRFKAMPLRSCFENPVDHPKEEERQARRMETQLTQAENFQSFPAYQKKRALLREPTPRRKYSNNEIIPKLTPNLVSGRTYQQEMDFQKKATEQLTVKLQNLKGEQKSARSSRGSASSSGTANSARMVFSSRSYGPPGRSRQPLITVRSVTGDIHENCRRAHQMMNESAHFCQNQKTANTYSGSMSTRAGQDLMNSRRNLSLMRLENNDFSITKPNSNWNRHCKLTRADGFYSKPKLTSVSSSVKFNILNNTVPPFIYH